MARNSGISWTDDSFNPWFGCSKVSPACKNCYAERLMDHRWHRVQWGPGKPRVRTRVENWNEVRKWNRTPFYEAVIAGQIVRGEQKDITKAHRELGEIHTSLREVRRRVFSASLADIFDEEVQPEWRKDFFDLVKETPNIDWLILTKRPELIGPMMEAATGIPMEERHNAPACWNFRKHLPQVLLGITGEDQFWLTKRTVSLFAHEATMFWLSAEPLDGPLNFIIRPYGNLPILWNTLTGKTYDTVTRVSIEIPKFGWVITGGETIERTMADKISALNPHDIREIRNQCDIANVPFHFKQWGNKHPDHPNEWKPESHNGNLLDGKQHLEFYQLP
jgi:protein gp37